MADWSLRVEHLGKRFRIGTRPSYRRFSELLQGLVRPRGAKRPGGPPASGHTVDFWALDDVSFEVATGEVLGIVGRNGAGKSTLLKIISRITPPTRGEVSIRGTVGSLLEVGTGFHPELTGRENIFLNGAILGIRRGEIRRRFDEIVEFAEVGPFLDTPVKRYSSGMFMRLAFAVAAHLEPDILIVDEVLAVGDDAFQKKCLGKMGDIAGSGRTVLFVSHNLAAVRRLCQRAIVLEKGRLLYTGDVASALNLYLENGRRTMSLWRREGPTPDVPHFRQVQLCNAAGQPTETVDSAEQFGVLITYATPRPTRGLMIGTSVESDTGHRLFSTVTPDAKFPLLETAGVQTFRVLFPPALFMPKSFAVSVSLYSVSENFDFLPQCLHWTVAPAASLGTSLPGGRWGDLQILCDYADVSGS